MVKVLDTKPYVRHHPEFGHQYLPGASMTLPRPGGGRYHIHVNSMGIRSDRDYATAKPAGVTRIIVCGDSMAAGQYVTNADRFSELLERRVPNLEVINLSLEGSGTDQQLLLYEHIGMQFEHDAVVLLPFLQNVRRNLVSAREAIDPQTRQPILRPKPRFELLNGRLELRNVPVPEQIAADQLPPNGANENGRVDVQRLKTRISRLPGARVWRRAIQTIVPWEPFPEYRDQHGLAWRLMEALIRRMKQSAGLRPLVVAPTFYSNYVGLNMGRAYWQRFASLASQDGIYPIDLLPYFRQISVRDGQRAFQDPYDMHFSTYGHQVLADAFETELRRLRVLLS